MSKAEIQERDAARRKRTAAHVHLAAGLSLTLVSGQKDAFKRYLLQRDSVDFTFRGVEYHIGFARADIFPQGFAVVDDPLREFRGVNMLTDIGNGTMNVMYINDRRPRRRSVLQKIRDALMYAGGSGKSAEVLRLCR